MCFANTVPQPAGAGRAADLHRRGQQQEGVVEDVGGATAPVARDGRGAEDADVDIEAAVRGSRPNWAQEDFLGEEVGAFADFLIWGLQAAPPLRAEQWPYTTDAPGRAKSSVHRPPSTRAPP